MTHSCKAVIYFLRKNICSKSDTTFYVSSKDRRHENIFLHHSLEMDEGSRVSREPIPLPKALSFQSVSQSSRILGKFCKLCTEATGKPRQASPLTGSVMPMLFSFCILTLYKAIWYWEPGKWQLLLGVERHVIIIFQLPSLTAEGCQGFEVPKACQAAPLAKNPLPLPQDFQQCPFILIRGGIKTPCKCCNSSASKASSFLHGFCS